MPGQTINKCKLHWTLHFFLVNKPYQTQVAPREVLAATSYTGFYFLWRNCPFEGWELEEIFCTCPIQRASLKALLLLGLGHEATDSNRMSPICICQLRIVLNGKLHQQGECRHWLSCMWPLSFAEVLECWWSSDPSHHQLQSSIFQETSLPCSDEDNKLFSLA